MPKKIRERNIPQGWTILERYQAPSGRWLERGTELKIRGERGRFRFVEYVQNANGAEWLYVRDRNQRYRAFRPERVTTVHMTTRMRGAK
jgi:hypothetical protein